jgi:hypothetical protein
MLSCMPMAKAKDQTDEPGTWIIREVPRDLMRRAKAAAAFEGKSIKALIIELMETHLQELERKGVMPKEK